MTPSEKNKKLKPIEQDRRERLRRLKPRAYEKVMQFSDKIQRGESIAAVVFQYNYACNFHCSHCSIKRLQNIKDRRSFTHDDVRNLSRQMDELGLANYFITGGEPLMFPDFDEFIAALDPSKFHIGMDSNGWLLDQAKAEHLVKIGIDKIELGFDSLSAEEHDAFRHRPGAHARCLRALDACLAVGLHIILQTVVTKQRIRSREFIDFLEFAKSKGVGVAVTYAKPVGMWEGNFDVLVDKDDMAHMRELEQKYEVFTHLTPGYGLNLGCIAVKRMITVTQFGDVLPCPYMQIALGNVLEEPLKDILERGKRIKYFGQYVDTCLMAEDRNFINKYVTKLYGKPLPVPHDQIFEEDDYL